MATQVQFRRGTTEQNNGFTGALAELSVDTTLNVVRVHNGSTQGGYALVGATASQTLTNKVYQGTSVSVTGTVTAAGAVINGDLTVTGNVTTVNSNVVTINDKFINLANNAATSAAADGSGIGVGPLASEYASITYNSTNNNWSISNGANISGAVGVTGNITGIDIPGYRIFKAS